MYSPVLALMHWLLIFLFTSPFWLLPLLCFVKYLFWRRIIKFWAILKNSSTVRHLPNHLKGLVKFLLAQCQNLLWISTGWRKQFVAEAVCGTCFWPKLCHMNRLCMVWSEILRTSKYWIILFVSARLRNISFCCSWHSSREKALGVPLRTWLPYFILAKCNSCMCLRIRNSETFDCYQLQVSEISRGPLLEIAALLL